MTLHDFLDEQEQIDERFKVENDQQANWALRKIKQKQDELQQSIDIADAEIHKIEQWKKQQTESANDSIEYFQSLLAEYATKKRASDPDFKSISLPNGRIGFRKRQPKWIYDDERLLETLKENEMSEFVRVTETPNKRDIRQAFTVVGNKVINEETGQVIEGITIEEQSDSFNVRVD